MSVSTVCCFLSSLLKGFKALPSKAFSVCAPRSGSLRDREVCEKCGLPHPAGWQYSIVFNHHHINSGRYDTADAAMKAGKEALKLLVGEK